MSGVNAETVAMMGAALAAPGKVQRQETVRVGESVARRQGAPQMADGPDAAALFHTELRAALKAQCASMKNAVERVFAGYDVDRFKDVRAILKSDGERLNYMAGSSRFELSGGFSGQLPEMEEAGKEELQKKAFQGDGHGGAAAYGGSGQQITMSIFEKALENRERF